MRNTLRAEFQSTKSAMMSWSHHEFEFTVSTGGGFRFVPGRNCQVCHPKKNHFVRVFIWRHVAKYLIKILSTQLRLIDREETSSLPYRWRYLQALRCASMPQKLQKEPGRMGMPLRRVNRDHLVDKFKTKLIKYLRSKFKEWIMKSFQFTEIVVLSLRSKDEVSDNILL